MKLHTTMARLQTMDTIFYDAQRQVPPERFRIRAHNIYEEEVHIAYAPSSAPLVTSLHSALQCEFAGLTHALLRNK